MAPVDAVIRKLRSIEGVIDLWQVENADRKIILELEKNANENVGLAIGVEISNPGATLALQREFALCVNHSPCLRHPMRPIVVLAADEHILGEEVWEPAKIARLESDSNALFLGNGFVLYRDRVNEARERRLRFEYRPQGFPEIETIEGVCDVTSATMSPAADSYIKRKARWPSADPETGTVLVGFNKQA